MSALAGVEEALLDRDLPLVVAVLFTADGVAEITRSTGETDAVSRNGHGVQRYAEENLPSESPQTTHDQRATDARNGWVHVLRDLGEYESLLGDFVANLSYASVVLAGDGAKVTVTDGETRLGR